MVTGGFLGLLFGAGVALAASVLQVQAVTLYVDGKSGSDTADGTSPKAAFHSLQKACNVVKPGDTVIVAPGVYLERVQLKTVGAEEKPIVFKADGVEKKRVILSGAVPAIRNREVQWQLDDENLKVYSVPLDFRPARVLYDDVDLLPYPSLETLKNFCFADGYPGDKHGFAQEGGRLYVRLRADGRYGSSNPNEHTMAVSTPIGGGNTGLAISKLEDYLFGILTQKPTYVVLDGFTFETPGTAAVYVQGSHVTVRNCWFIGCRSGVAGRPAFLPGAPSSPDFTKTTNNITIEYCDISSFPTFDDMKEMITEHKDDPWRGDRTKLDQRIYWWQRKEHLGYNYTYETGIGTNIGSDWVIRHNYMHDGLEFLSCWATNWSRNLQAYENRFERLVDNAVEAEGHSYNLRFFDNEIVDVFEPFSWQPLGGTPWPGPDYFYRNIVWMTKENLGIWKIAGTDAGVWKLGASEKNWRRKDIQLAPDEPVRPPEDGCVSFNNSVYCPDHVLITRVQTLKRKWENFHFFNNVIVVSDLSGFPQYTADDTNFVGNVGVFSTPANPAAISNFAGNNGKSLQQVEEIGFADGALGHFELKKNWPSSRSDFGQLSKEALPTAGAILFGKKWTPLVVGPQNQKKN